MRSRATPWDALLRAPARPLAAPLPAQHPSPEPANKTAMLVAKLAQADSLPTLALGALCELETRHVWGLLKTPRERGQVIFEQGRWRLNRAWHGHDIERAAALLREAGWTVKEPR